METQNISGQDMSSLANGSSQIASSALEVLDQVQSFLTSNNAPKQLDYVYDITDFAAQSALIEKGSLSDLNLPQGDEGELFRNVVKGNTLSESELDGILADDDSGWITVNQTPVFVEQYASNAEFFTLRNLTPYTIAATLDGRSWIMTPNYDATVASSYGGVIKFNVYGSPLNNWWGFLNASNWRSRNLATGSYDFRLNLNTSVRNDIELYNR